MADLAVVVFLPLVGQHGADDVAGVLDHHLARLDVPLAEQAAAVDLRPGAGGTGRLARSNGISRGMSMSISVTSGAGEADQSPVNPHGLHGGFLQVSEAHGHGKLCAGGASVGRAAPKQSRIRGYTG